MKVTVDISEKDLRDIQRFSGERKKGPAITKFLATELMLKRRHELNEKVLSGELSAEITIKRHKRDFGIW